MLQQTPVLSHFPVDVPADPYAAPPVILGPVPDASEPGPVDVGADLAHETRVGAKPGTEVFIELRRRTSFWSQNCN